MATCQKKLQTGTGVRECALPAPYLCVLPATYTRYGRLAERTEYRCLEHREGEWVRVRGGHDQ